MGLKGITIETPPQAEAHINAADDRAIWEAVIGMDGVVNVGQKLKATLISNNLLRVYDGALVVGGAVGRIPFGEYEDITINNGTQNQLRNDLVVAQIEANGAIENMKLHYIQGVPGEVAKDPDYTAGNVYEGETLRQYPLYRVKLNGLNVEAVEPLFEVLPNLGKVKDEVGELNRKLVQTEAWKIYSSQWTKDFLGKKARPQKQLTLLPRFTLHMSLFQRLFSNGDYFFTCTEFIGTERLKSGIKYSITILIQIVAHMSGAHIPRKHSIG
ncbi:MAG: hypothetical protein ACLR71_19495 [[Clostridium] scindens]